MNKNLCAAPAGALPIFGSAQPNTRQALALPGYEPARFLGAGFFVDSERNLLAILPKLFYVKSLFINSLHPSHEAEELDGFLRSRGTPVRFIGQTYANLGCSGIPREGRDDRRDGASTPTSPEPETVPNLRRSGITWDAVGG